MYRRSEMKILQEIESYFARICNETERHAKKADDSTKRIAPIKEQ